MKRVFRLEAKGKVPLLNLRWNALGSYIELTDDEWDTVAELRCGESFKTKDGFTVKRQDS